MMFSNVLCVAAFVATSSFAQFCNVADQRLVGNGWCNYDEPGYNTRECRWDGGDCCASTCSANSDLANYTCGINGFMCFDPQTEEDVVSLHILSQNRGRDTPRGLPDPFLRYQREATSVGSESFGALASQSFGPPLCATTNITLTIVPLTCVPIAPAFRIRGENMVARQRRLRGVPQSMVCADQLFIEFEPSAVALATLQIARSPSSPGSDSVSVSFEVISNHDLDLEEEDTLTVTFASGEQFMDIGLMSLKGSEMQRLEFGDSVCVNSINIFSGSGNFDRLSIENSATTSFNVPLTSVVVCALATLFSTRA